MCASVCIFVCVNVCVNMLPGRQSSEKNQHYGIKHFQSNGASPVVLLLDLVLDFQGQAFGNLFDLRISRKWER